MEGSAIRILSYRFEGSDEERQQFDKWYSEVHVPQVLNRPGYLAGYRYQGVEDPCQYVTIYVFDNTDALREALEGLKNHPNLQEQAEWRKWEKSHLADLSRTNYRQMYP